MKILCTASEVEPFAKTGGLADVAGSLPQALARLGHDVRIAMPLYRQVDRTRWGLRPTAVRVSVPIGPHTIEGRVWEGPLPACRDELASRGGRGAGRPVCATAADAPGRPKGPVTTYFIEAPTLFDREGLYQDRGVDYPDNLARFSFFSQACLRMLPTLGWRPEVMHCHDWQTALACAHLTLGPMAKESFFASIGTVFTIHNLSYQGLFPKDQWPHTNLPQAAFTMQGLEFYDQINCLKGGLVCARVLTTVSPTYGREIQTAEFGCGLEGVLRARAEDLVGIVNGIDIEEWNPHTDPHAASRYSVEEMAGKSLCKLALQKRERLPQQHDLLIGMVQRLVEQKGLDIFLQALEPLLALPLQIVILGTGTPSYQQQLAQWAKRVPERLAVNLTFDNALAHQIEAGADAFLMPSRFEPCGLNQMYSMRFGTVPIVRRVGGLADTVIDVTPATCAAKTATGFLFEEYSSTALVDAVRRAVTAFRDHHLWTGVMRTGMRQDFSWDRSARAYVQVYEQARAKRRLAGVAR